jgi:hypothetical protein
MEKDKSLQQLTSALRVNQIALVRGYVHSLLLAKYRLLWKARIVKDAQRDDVSPLEGFHIIPSYRAGDPQPLVEWLRWHAENGLALSPGMYRFLAEAVRTEPLKRGPKKSVPVEQRDLRLAISMAAYMLVEDLNYQDALATVAEETGLSDSMIGRAYNRYASYFSQQTNPDLPNQS